MFVLDAVGELRFYVGTAGKKLQLDFFEVVVVVLEGFLHELKMTFEVIKLLSDLILELDQATDSRKLNIILEHRLILVRFIFLFKPTKVINLHKV